MLTLEQVTGLFREIKKAGGQPYLIGGSVRDMQLGVESKDYDVEVFQLQPEKLREVLETLAPKFGVKLNCVGESFQVYKFGLNVDISIPRRDHNIGEGHKDFIVEGDPFMSLEDAARRRDFTMNAMFYDLDTFEVIDPFGGSRDLLVRNALRMVDKDTFVEDPLRALRAVQFISRFDLNLDSATYEVIRKMDLSSLPRERVWGEFEKLMMKSRKPSVGLFIMHSLGINEKLFPELHVLGGVPQSLIYHPEGDVLTHSFYASDVAKTVIEDLSYAKQVTVVLASLFHDLGKFETTQIWHNGSGDGTNAEDFLCIGEFLCGFVHDGTERITAHGHAEAGVSLARNMLDRFNLHSIDGYDVRGQILALVEYHMHPSQFSRDTDIKDSAFRRLSTKVDLDLLHRVFYSDAMSRNFNSLGVKFTTETPDWFKEKITNLEIKSEGPERILMGRHLIELGVKPSKEMGRILDAVFEMQLEGQVMTLDQALEAAKLELEMKSLKAEV
jgi:tRNA nucleotidyltransferase (CCA-adding enzyme)